MNTIITEDKIEVKPGYKKTPVGIIPEDWEVKELGDLCEDICGEYGANKSAIPYSTDLPRYVRITDINDEGNLHFDSKASANLSLEEEKKFKLEHHDLLFARTGATVGKSYLHRNETDEKFVYAGFLIRFRLCPNKVNPIFIKEYTDTSKYWHWVKTYSTRSGQPGLNSNEYKSLKLPIPPLPEQKAIADCLSTWDKGIEKLSALIASKKEQKKGLMQGIFSGKLKVENGELVKVEDEKLWLKGWKEVRLGDIGFVPNKQAVTEIGDKRTLTVRLYTKGIDFNDNAKTKITSSGRNYYIREVNEILIGRQNIHNGGIGLVKNEHDGHICSNAITSYIVNESNNMFFILYLLSFPCIYRPIERYMLGTGQKELSEKEFLNLSFKLPKLDEQNAIAKVLFASEKEIELLEQKLESFKIQKKGLMQVLLTGEKRLIK